MEAGEIPGALELFNGLRPMDQGEILEKLSRKFSSSLLAELDALVLAAAFVN